MDVWRLRYEGLSTEEEGRQRKEEKRTTERGTRGFPFFTTDKTTRER